MLTPAVVLLITLPWLNPFAPGPSPAVAPLLFSWVCAAGLLGIYGPAVSLSQSTRFTSTAAAPWLAAGLLSSAVGLFQYFGGGGSLLPWVNQAELGQAFGNLRQRNQFASLTNIALAALVWVVASGRMGTAKYWPKYGVLALLCAGLLAAGNAASSSRTGLVQLLLLCMLWLWWCMGRSRHQRRAG